MSDFIIQETPDSWEITCGTVRLNISKQNGCVSKCSVQPDGKEWLTWSAYDGDVTVEDQLLRQTFGREQLADVRFNGEDNSQLVIRKHFTGAQWTLEERYHADDGALAWDAAILLPQGDYRSCCISWKLPWPRDIYSIGIWTARHNMPTELQMHAGTSLEYGEITSGIAMPTIICYHPSPDSGLLLTMPFDFKTPRFSFFFGLRELELCVRFDWLALSPSHTPRAKLLLHGTVGDWRPGLGWLYNRYREYFEPESTLIPKLWGGHICGTFDPSEAEIDDMARLGIKWYEIHEHFYAYGNYNVTGIDSWRSGHALDKETPITVDMIHDTIRRLHARNVAAMPYIQVNGDGDEKLLAPEMATSRLKDRRGETFCSWPGTLMMNSDLNLPFGKDIARQIDGMAERYPEMDGVFLDQACYNLADTAHDDGITAIDNRPAYMNGFCYDPQIEHLSQRLHPNRAIIGNGPNCIRIMRHIDAIMAEGSSWLCDHLQYFCIGTKPVFFLMYSTNDADVELMFQKALLHGAGFTSYPKAMPSSELYDMYVPILERLYRRRWVFDRNPLQTPTGICGNVFRSERGTILVSCVRNMARAARNADVAVEEPVVVSLPEVSSTRECTLYQPGIPAEKIDFSIADGKLSFHLPRNFTAGLVEF